MGVWIRRSNPVAKAWLDSTLREYDTTTTSREGRSTFKEGEMKTDEDDEFDRIERENKIKGQPYHFASQSTWVELDGEDYIKAYELCDFDKVAAFEFFEAKLKEKNT
jgi:hypothetical protein